MNLIKKLSNTNVAKKIMSMQANREASEIAHHFDKFLFAKIAQDEAGMRETFKIRHDVYCAELKFEEERPDQLESDEFDAFSTHCLIQHINTGEYAGTVRMVRPTEKDQKLPMEVFCKEALEGAELHPAQYERHKICEISRLAVPAKFRRRKTDQHEGASTGVINEQTYSETELRCFPFIAIGLYLSAASVCHHQDIDHVFVMMEPRLARSMKFVGINFVQLGEPVEYHGLRAPYYIDPYSLFETLKPGFLSLMMSISSTVEKQVGSQES